MLKGNSLKWSLISLWITLSSHVNSLSIFKHFRKLKLRLFFRLMDVLNKSIIQEHLLHVNVRGTVGNLITMVEWLYNRYMKITKWPIWTNKFIGCFLYKIFINWFSSLQNILPSFFLVFFEKNKINVFSLILFRCSYSQLKKKEKISKLIFPTFFEVLIKTLLVIAINNWCLK